MALVATSDSLSADKLASIASVKPDRAINKGEVRQGAIVPIAAEASTWEIREQGNGDISVDQLIERLFVRASRNRASLLELRNNGCQIKLEIVQWISSSDRQGPGFSVSREMLELLAAMDALIDVDQYLVE